MVQLGVTENPKENALKQPVPAADTTVVVLQPTTPPTAKKSCCTKRVMICISVTCVLLAMTIAGIMLALYIRRDLCFTYWGACGHYYGDDILYDSDFPMWSEGEPLSQFSAGSSGSVSILGENFIGEWQDDGLDGDHEGGPHVDRSGDHMPGNPGEHTNPPPNPPPELTRRR